MRPHQQTERQQAAMTEPVVLLTTGEMRAVVVTTRRGRQLQQLVGRAVAVWADGLSINIGGGEYRHSRCIG